MKKIITFIKQRKIVSLVVIIILIAGGYYWYNKSKSSTAAVQYKTTIVEKGSLTTSVSGSGNVTVDQLASIDPTISGTVAGLAVNVGDNVKKGQLLFTIINNDLTVSSAKSVASLQQSKNSLDSAELQVEQAEDDYDAAKKDGTSTHDEKDMLKKKITIAKNGVVASQKSYTATLADYNNQQSVAGERKVLAPIDGTVSAINVKNGDDLGKSASSSSSYSAPIIIGDLATLKAEVQVNEVDIPDVALGQKVMMTFGAIENLTVSGKVEKMDALGTITQGVVNYNVIIGFDTLDKRIKPSMSVSAKIITGIKQDVIVVPNSALKTQNNTTYIEVLSDDSQAPGRRTIEIGAANNTETEIVSGINVGDNIVTQTIDPNAKTTTTTGGLFGGGGRGGGMGELH
jgi:RND family efflux transporter MFP subunit